MIIGVLSDTHGTIHPRLVPLFHAEGVDLILHAGDVCTPEVLDELSAYAPVRVALGNNDRPGVMLAADVQGVLEMRSRVGQFARPACREPEPGERTHLLRLVGSSADVGQRGGPQGGRTIKLARPVQ